MSSMPENPIVDSKNDEFASMLPKMTAILDFTHNAMPKVFFYHYVAQSFFLPLCRAWPKT